MHEVSNTYINIYICFYVSAYVDMYACVNIYTYYIYMCVYVYVYTHIRIMNCTTQYYRTGNWPRGLFVNECESAMCYFWVEALRASVASSLHSLYFPLPR